MKKVLLALVVVLTLAQVAQAAEVRVFGDRFDLNIINDFYGSMAHNSSILANLATADSHRGEPALGGANRPIPIPPGKSPRCSPI